MKTEIISENISRAAELIRSGELVAVPTETVYGLAGNGLCAEAVESIYEVKGRPQVKPLSLMVPDAGAMGKYCANVPEQAYLLAERFWPGPLTVVLHSADCVPDIVRAGGATVGLRCPDHEMTLKLLREVGLPLAAPSANPSGEPSPKTAQEVSAYFSGKISGIIDGGACTLGTESTIIDMSSTPYRILRQGALSRESIEKTLTDAMTVVGITGGTGCGKTTALRELESMGALVIDCDAVYHELLASDTDMLRQLRERFPSAFEGGVLDRKKLGAIVFSDESKLTELNGITHECVLREVDERLRSFAMNGGRLAALDAIALFESGAASKCSFTVGVLADRETRIQRIMQRDGISHEYASARVKAQKPDEYFTENCTYVLRNDGTETEFIEKCKLFYKEVLT